MAKARIIERREIFIEAVVKVIAKVGIDKTTTRLIATEAGTSLASLHYCFESKETLYLEAYKHLLYSLSATCLTPYPGIGLGRGASTILRNMMNWYRTQPGYSQTQIEISFWAFRQDKIFYQRQYRELISGLEQTLHTAAAPKDDIKLVAGLARLIVAAIDGIVSQSLFYEDKPVRLEEMLEASAEALELYVDSHKIAC